MTLSKMNMLAGMVMAGAIVAAVPASAQTTPTVQVSGGYQFLNLSFEGEGETLGKGWYGEVAGHFTPMFSAVFEVGGNYKSVSESLTINGVTTTLDADFSVHQFLGGVRVSHRRNPSLVPFGQVLFGGVNVSVEGSGSASIGGGEIFSFSEGDAATEFAMQIAGGLDLRVTDRAGIRVGAGYTRIFADEGVNAFRAIIGVVFPFSR